VKIEKTSASSESFAFIHAHPSLLWMAPPALKMLCYSGMNNTIMHPHSSLYDFQI
jgi:hypothetical protein